MGLRVNTNIKDFEMVAEFNKNMSFRQFMHPKAKKFREDAEAYYINVKRDWGKLSVGTEYFKMEPGYSTVFENTDPAYFAMKTVIRGETDPTVVLAVILATVLIFLMTVSDPKFINQIFKLFFPKRKPPDQD